MIGRQSRMTVLAARTYDNRKSVVGMSSPGGENSPKERARIELPNRSGRRRFKPSGDDSPSPGGEGRGEGELSPAEARGSDQPVHEEGRGEGELYKFFTICTVSQLVLAGNFPFCPAAFKTKIIP